MLFGYFYLFLFIGGEVKYEKSRPLAVRKISIGSTPAERSSLGASRARLPHRAKWVGLTNGNAYLKYTQSSANANSPETFGLPGFA